MTATAAQPTPQAAPPCPEWCKDHAAGPGVDAPGWHNSRDFKVGEHTVYLSDGTVSGVPELCLATPEAEHQLSLTDAEILAAVLYGLAQDARESHGIPAAGPEGTA